MPDISNINRQAVRKVMPVASPKLPVKPTVGISTLVSNNIPQQKNNKPLLNFGGMFKPKTDDTFIAADSFKLNKPISEGQKGVVMSLVANIAKGEDNKVIRQKFPEIADIGDKSLEALRANVMRGDPIDDIIQKYPEFQWIKEGGVETDKYKYNIAQKPYKFIQGLIGKAEDINVPVVEPVVKGGLGVLGFGTKGVRDVIQGGAGLLDKAIGGDKVYKGGVTEDVFDIGQGAINTAAAIYAPVAGTALGAVMSSLPASVSSVVGETFGDIGAYIAKVPGLKQIKDRLPEERKQEFDNEVAGAVAGLLLGVKNKGQLISNPKQFIKTNLSPKTILQNIEQNVLNIPGKVAKIPSGIKESAKGLGETAISSNWKIQPAIKSKFEETFGNSIERFALDNNLIGKDVSDSAKIADNFKIEKMVEKIDNVRNLGWTKNDDAYKKIASRTAKMFKETFSDYVGKKIEDFTDEDWALIKRVDQTGYDIYKELDGFMNKDEVTYLQLEGLKEVFDYYNPAGLEYDYRGKPVNVGKKDTWYGSRDYLQKAIEKAGEDKGIDIKGLNDDIRKAHILYRGLTKADARMSNHNILGLMDTQVATLGALIGGDVAGIGSLLARKALQSDSFLSGIAKKLYGTKPRTPYSGIGTTGVGRAGRISSILRSTPDFRQKLKALPESPTGIIDEGGTVRLPKRLDNLAKLKTSQEDIPLPQSTAPKKKPKPNLPINKKNKVAEKSISMSKIEDVLPGKEKMQQIANVGESAKINKVTESKTVQDFVRSKAPNYMKEYVDQDGIITEYRYKNDAYPKTFIARKDIGDGIKKGDIVALVKERGEINAIHKPYTQGGFRYSIERKVNLDDFENISKQTTTTPTPAISKISTPNTSNVDESLLAEARKYKSADEFVKKFQDETYNSNNINKNISDKAKEFNRKYVPMVEDITMKKYKENIQSIIEDRTLDTDIMLEKIRPIKEKLYSYQKSQLRKIREEANK